MRCLILRLEAPIVAFGDVAIDERMPSARFPALSMVVGLIASAMGLTRRDVGRTQAIQDGILIASRLDRPGTRMEDYHTAQVYSSDKGWTTRGRLAERAGKPTLEATTIVMHKEYIADPMVTMTVDAGGAADEIADALSAPARPLFLGRCCCPPTTEILRGMIDADDVFDALCRAPADADLFHGVERTLEVKAQWPASIAAGRTARLHSVSDVKDWRHRVHVGGRDVREGIITLERQ